MSSEKGTHTILFENVWWRETERVARRERRRESDGTANRREATWCGIEEIAFSSSIAELIARLLLTSISTDAPVQRTEHYYRTKLVYTRLTPNGSIVW